MTTKISKMVVIYLYFCFFVFAVGLGTVYYYFWSSGLYNIEHVAQISDKNSKLSDLQKSKYLQGIFHFVANDNIREAKQHFNSFDSQINFILQNHSYDNKLKSDISKYKGLLNDLSSHPQKKRILRVFQKKLYNFHKTVKRNNWKTLTGISKRMISKIDRSIFNKKTNSFMKSFKSDIRIMTSILKSSMLSKRNKTMLSGELASLTNDLTKLKSYEKEFSSYKVYHQKFYETFQAWIKRTSADFTLEKIQHDQKLKLFTLSLSVPLILLFACFIFAPIIYIKSKRSSLKIIESNISQFINCLFRPTKPEISKPYSQDFSSKIIKAHKYIQKRIDFSSIFQNTLPFPAILLDDNLKVIWANSFFCDDWKLESLNIDSNLLSWDYLAKFTNLGESDPIAEALNNQVAGIYQIQTRVDQNSSPMPYEMYVSPTQSGHQRRIMIIFYPLISIEETIQHQAKSILAPIKKALKALEMDDFSSESREQIRMEAISAGIKDIYEDLINLHRAIASKNNSLLEEIDEVENKNRENQRLFSTISNIQNHILEKSDYFSTNLSRLRDSIIKLSELKNKSSEEGLEFFSLLHDLLIEFKKLLETTDHLALKVEKSDKSLEQIANTRAKLKESKDRIKLAKDHFLTDMDQLFLFNKTRDYDPKQIDEIFSRIRSDAKIMEANISHYEKDIMALDIQLSKVKMLSEENDEIPHRSFLEHYQGGIRKFQEKIDSNADFNNRQKHESHKIEDQIVGHLGDLLSELTAIKKAVDKGRALIPHEISQIKKTKERPQLTEGEQIIKEQPQAFN